MLRWRIISAIVIVAIFASGCWMDVRYPPAGIGGLWLMPIGALVCLLATWEVCRLVFRKITPVHIGMLSIGNLLIFLSAGFPKVLSALGLSTSLTALGWPMLLFSLATCVAFGEQMRTYKMGDRAISRLGRSVLVMAYAGLLTSFFVALRHYGSNELGFVALTSLIIVVKMSDIGAYTVGRICGGRFSGAARLAPVLSPKKTLEGSVGGILFGCLGSYLALLSTRRSHGQTNVYHCRPGFAG